jgi:hypothetical protein
MTARLESERAAARCRLLTVLARLVPRIAHAMTRPAVVALTAVALAA